MDFDVDTINERIRGMAEEGESFGQATATSGKTDYFSQAMQTMLTLGGSYLQRRMDVDLDARMAGRQQLPVRVSNQRFIGDHAPAATQPQPAGLSGLVPLLIVGGIVFLLARG